MDPANVPATGAPKRMQPWVLMKIDFLLPSGSNIAEYGKQRELLIFSQLSSLMKCNILYIATLFGM